MKEPAISEINSIKAGFELENFKVSWSITWAEIFCNFLQTLINYSRTQAWRTTSAFHPMPCTRNFRRLIWGRCSQAPLALQFSREEDELRGVRQTQTEASASTERNSEAWAAAGPRCSPVRVKRPMAQQNPSFSLSRRGPVGGSIAPRAPSASAFPAVCPSPPEAFLVRKGEEEKTWRTEIYKRNNNPAHSKGQGPS